MGQKAGPTLRSRFNPQFGCFLWPCLKSHCQLLQNFSEDDSWLYLKIIIAMNSLTQAHRNLFVDIAAYSLCFLFVYAGTAKLFKLDLFQFQLQAYPWLRHAARTIGWLVPLTELGVAALLLTPKGRKWGLIASLALMLIFTIYLICMVAGGDHLPCTCGGVISSLSWNQHIWFNILFIVLAATGLYIHHHKRQVYET